MHKEVIFLGSKPVGYSCLSYLLSVQDSYNCKVKGILTQSRNEFKGDYNLASLAAEHNIPVFDSIDDIPETDILYSVQYHKILKQVHISKAREIALNLHMAPLPEYRGSNQFSYAILEGKPEFGVTIHQMDTRIDHGDILFQQRFPIPAGCWVNELYDLTEKSSIALFKSSLENILTGQYTLTPQSSLEGEYGTSLHLRNEINNLKEIDLNWDKEKINRHIRATLMPGFEPPYCFINGQKVYFTKQYQ